MKIFRIFSVIFLLIVIVLGLTFAAINATPVTIHYYVGTATINLSLLLVYSLGIGILLGFLTTFSSVLRLKKKVRQLKSQLKQSEKQLAKKTAEPPQSPALDNKAQATKTI